MYINLLYLPLFNFVYLFFLSLPLNIFVHFIFIVLFPSQHLALVLFSSFCLSLFCSGRYNFWFPLFAGSVYYILFLLECFDFAYGWICICVYSVTLFIAVINLCLYIGFLQFCGAFPFFFLFLSSLCLFFIIFNFFKLIIYFPHLFLCLPFLLFFSLCS